MAQLIGGLATSHIPAIGGAIHKGLQQDPYWKPFFDGFPPIRQWLSRVKPDVVVVFYNDHGLNFFLDKMPTFAVGAAPLYENADEGWGIPTLPAFKGDLDLSWHIINSVTAKDFDLVTCQELQVDHACTLPLKLLWPEAVCPVSIVPVCINTVQFPLPSAKRVYALGRAVGEAVKSWNSDKKVAVLGTGGLSHQLDGERAGFINKEFDLQFLDSMLTNPEWATQFSILELVEKTGTQGVELLMWLAMRAALTTSNAGVRKVHSNYHIPISNTATGVLALESLPAPAAAALSSAA
jgi:protocatechuate 4,5-dioxygenase beta chain